MRHRYHLHLPEETVWAYDGLIPGPTFMARTGQPVAVHIRNELPQNHVGYGSSVAALTAAAAATTAAAVRAAAAAAGFLSPPLLTRTGQRVRFYDDIVEGNKAVVFNMI